MNNNKKKKKTHVPLRLNLLFFVVFLLFSALILRLGVVQIVYGNDFKRELERTSDVAVSTPVPRGKIYDRNGKVIVDNTPLNAITYTKYQNADQKEMLQVAEQLSKYIHMDTKKVQERDMKDYWLMIHPDEAKLKITNADMVLYKQKKLDDKGIYKLQLDRVTKEELGSLTEKDMQVLAIFRQFNSGYALTPQIVKNKGVTPKEYAVVSENLDKLPGVDTTTDWDRSYVFGNTLKTVLGKVTSSDEGIPKELLDYYLARGYNRNERVGKSYLELQYEDVLHGEKAKVKNKTDKSGNIVSTEVISEGKRGKDLVLTIDMDLQTAVEKILEKELWTAKQQPSSSLLDRAFVVLMDPHTGDVLTMAGKQIVKNEQTGKMEMKDFALGNISTSYNVGSAVKGATILTGYKTGAIHPNSFQLDEPLRIKGTQVKKSWKTFGSLNDLRALQVSSNVYMWKTVIAMAGGHYTANQPLNLNMKTFDTVRQSFSQFGLGVRTGIDLPNETTGYPGPTRLPGLLLDLVIGQYDTYTPMQLAQYVSTIANGGYRVQPHLVKEIREPIMDNKQMGPVIQEIEPKILNRIDEKDEWINRVQKGFKMVMQEQGGTAYSYFRNASYNPAGKTGTAQAFYDGPDRKKYKEAPQVMNLSIVAYAPADNPEVAMAVMVPWAYSSASGRSTNEIIGRSVLDAYFALKKERMAAESGAPTPSQTSSSSGSAANKIGH